MFSIYLHDYSTETTYVLPCFFVIIIYVYSSTMSINRSEQFSLIWLDAIVDNSIENVETQSSLRNVIHNFKAFQQADSFIHFIQASTKSRLILIVSGRLGQEVVPQIHRLCQVYSIFVYCSDKERNERWAKTFSKVQHVITRPDDLISKIRSYIEKFSLIQLNEPLSPVFFHTTIELNDYNQSFLYSQFLVDYLLNIKSIITDEKDLIAYAKDEYKGNENELNLIRDFEENYSSDQALWWYTRDTFLYRLLNKAFRLKNLDLIFIFQFFIRDMQRSIEQNKSSNSLCVYRSDFISNEKLQIWKNYQREFVSFDGFLIANLHRQQTLAHFNQINDHEQVLFEISIDPRVEPMKPFCNLSSLCYYFNEEQIMFSFGTIFVVDSVLQQDDRIWLVRLQIASGKHRKLKNSFDCFKNQYLNEEINLLSLGRVLRKTMKYDEAERFYRRLLKELPSNHMNLVDCHYNLGLIFDEKHDYENSLEWHRKAIEIKRQSSRIDASLGYNYNSLANVYQKTGDYKRAEEYYQKALHLWEKIYGENHLDLAMCWNNLGCLYEIEKDYSRALDCYEKALAMKKLFLPENDFNLSLTHNNLACLYGLSGQIDLAIEKFYLTLQIQLKHLPTNYHQLAITYKNLGLIYEIKNDFNQAKVFYEKSATIRRHLLPLTHPDVIQIEQDLRRATSKIQEK